MTLPSTAYAPSPGRTDSEYNELRKENEKLNERVRILVNFLRYLLTEPADHASRHAADNGPEVVYDWSEDEDSALYQEPFERLPNTGGYNFPQTHDLPEGSPGIRAVDSPDTTTEEP